MKNKALIVTNIILLCCIIIGLLIFMIFGMTGKYHFWDTKSSVVQVKTFDFNNIQKVSSDVKSYDITMEPSLDNQIKVEVYGSEKSAKNIKIEVVDNELHINQVGSTVCFGFCYSDAKIVVSLPENVWIPINLKAISGDITVKSLLNNEDNSIKTTSGDITVRYANQINVKSTSGDIELGEVRNAIVASTSGDILVSKGELLNVQSMSGEIEINRLAGSCDLKSTSGDITIEDFTIDANSNIEATSGDVFVSLKNEANIYADTRSGDQHIKKSRGDFELNIKTTSGDVIVK